jgi:DNA topoisomerase-1
MLLKRKAAAGKEGTLFQTDAKQLRDYAYTLDGGKFKTKDFRTMVGTTTALDVVKTMEAPSTFEKYKQAVKKVATIVSQKLGNTPTIALQSYIHPVVFAKWQKMEWRKA